MPQYCSALTNVGGYGNHFFNEVLNIHAPIQHRRIKGNSNPWITPEIKYMMRNRDYHKKHAIKHASASRIGRAIKSYGTR
jgi:hypothetical protein